jgi:heterotetrameric sarcosine oxidase delta subunit
MLITCPYCGPRDLAEFTYQGDANRTRPDPASTDQEAWDAYVYDRVNTMGEHNEYWQHSGGCRQHLAVTRNTLTHEIVDVAFVRPELKHAHARQEAPTEGDSTQ